MRRLGVALDTFDAEGCVYRARGRELLARTGSLARIDSRYLRVLPKVRTPPTGRPAFSRYACLSWWEAMDVPPKAVHFIEVAELVIVSLIREDLAQNDDVAQLIR